MSKETEYYEQTKNLSCAICGYFCNNAHHSNNWFDTTKPLPESKEPQDAFKLVRSALQELVYLKSIKGSEEFEEEYERRKPPAWANAKLALGKTLGQSTPQEGQEELDWDSVHREYMEIPLNKRPHFFPWLKNRFTITRKG